MNMMPHATVQMRGYCSRRGYDRLDSVLNALRIVSNAALEERIGAYRKHGTSRSLYDQMKGLTQVRKADPDGFGKLHVGVARGALRQLDRAMQAFFRRVKKGEKPGFPRFKSRGRFVTMEVNPVGPRVVQQRGQCCSVKLKGLPKIKLRPSRPLPASKRIKSLRIVRRPTGCTVDVVYAVEQEPLPASQAAVGIDMGLRKRCTLSNGETLPPFTRDEARATALQQRISRCQQGSKKRKKAVRHYARFRRRETVRNRNACHRLTTDLIKRFGLIAIESLKIKNLVRSAKGTTEEPGRNVSPKAG